MAAATLFDPGGGLFDPGGPRGKGRVITLGRVAAAAGIGLALFIVWTFVSAELVTERPNEMKTTQVFLPPPPPPPPPEPVQVEQPPEPTMAPPIEQAVDTPPPPDQAPSSDPTAGDSALTAREGAGPSNYGLQRGDGTGTRIGTRPGGGDNGFAAYAGVARSTIQIAAQSDRDLARGRYTVRLRVAVDAEGRITDVRVTDGSGDSRRDDRLRRILTGLQLSRRPPPGLPAMNIELNSRPGA